MNQNTKPTGAGEFVTQAYNLDNREDMLDFYATWAEDYDNQMETELGYSAPQMIADILCSHLRDKSGRILDIGCGTGLTSKYLRIHGCDNLHGIDISQEMLKVAEKRSLYSSLKTGDLNQPLDYPDHYFDAAISSGTFTHGHVGPQPLDEIFRVMKSGALLACTVHIELWQSRGFEDKFKELEYAGKIACVSKKKDRYYHNGEPEGWFCLYKKH